MSWLKLIGHGSASRSLPCVASGAVLAFIVGCAPAVEAPTADNCDGCDLASYRAFTSDELALADCHLEPLFELGENTYQLSCDVLAGQGIVYNEWQDVAGIDLRLSDANGALLAKEFAFGDDDAVITAPFELDDGAASTLEMSWYFEGALGETFTTLAQLTTAQESILITPPYDVWEVSLETRGIHLTSLDMYEFPLPPGFEFRECAEWAGCRDLDSIATEGPYLYKTVLMRVPRGSTSIILSGTAEADFSDTEYALDVTVSGPGHYLIEDPAWDEPQGP